jgi:hypothetical protein
MLGEGGTPLSKLLAAIRDFQARDERRVDPKGLREAIDALEGEFATEAREIQKSGDHMVGGNIGAATWIGRTCGISKNSAADRLCVGEQLESLPKIAAALSSGEISYQSTSVLCHLRDKLADHKDLFDEDEMLDHARRFSVAVLHNLCRVAWHVVNPDGFFNEAEADFTRRRLHISMMSDGMHAIDGVLDPICGAAVRTVLDALAKPQGLEDERTRAQRMADALGEVVQHAMDEGKLPRRNGVRPHVTVTTTLEGLKNEVGATPADVELSLPISTRTLERIACDCTISRVLLSDSMVIDVGRATRVISGPANRALRARDRGCRFPGCDRPANWTQAHHLVAWSKGGKTEVAGLVLLCHFHHRLVHEGGWRAVKIGAELRFIPPDHHFLQRARGPGVRWAA